METYEGDLEDTGGRRPRPPRDEGPVLQVWHLLASMGGIMAILLGAHYAFIMASVRAEIREHELREANSLAPTSAGNLERERRIGLLEQADLASVADRRQLREDIERIEKEITLIKERQAQVRARLKLNGADP